MEGVDSFFHCPTVTEDKNTELLTNLGIKRAGHLSKIIQGPWMFIYKIYIYHY